MFSFFKPRKPKKSSYVYDQAVILEYTLKEELGTKQERALLGEVEQRIRDVLPSSSGVDGHEYGDSKCLIYIYGPNADDIFNAIESIVSKPGLKMTATLQYGLPDDPNTVDKTVRL